MWEAHAHRKRVLYIHGDDSGYSFVLASAGPDNMRVGGVYGLHDEHQSLLDSILMFLE